MKKVILYISAVLLVAYVAYVFAVGSSFASNSRCGHLYIRIESGDSVEFVTRKFIGSELERLQINPYGKKMDSINTQRIENAFRRKDYVEDARCYKAGYNSIVLSIEPIKPVMRVFKNNRSYYMNRSGKLIASDERFFVDLPVVAGNFNDRFPPTRLLPVVDYVESKPELRNLVSMIEVKDSDNIFVVPNIAGHVVNMGNADNWDSKFRKLFRMYKEVMPVKGWDAYDTINLKWDYRIVATKRSGGSRLKVAEYLPEDDEVAPDIETVTSGKATVTSGKAKDADEGKQNKNNKEKNN